MCTESPDGVFQDATPCEDMGERLLVSTGSDGNFVFADVPIGRYVLVV